MIQKIHVLTAILLIGTCCALFLTGLVKATETKEELEFYNHKNAAITYSYSVKEAADENCWQVQLNRKEIENKTNQRLKIKMTDSENQAIAYPVLTGMIVQEGWLVEKEFSSAAALNITFNLPKDIQTIRLIIQMDEQVQKEEGKIIENILPDGILRELSIPPATKESHAGVLKTKEKKSPIGPMVESQSSETAVSKKGSRVQPHRPVYTNKIPEYSPDDPQVGIYPIPSWQPEGQENVLNHQGGLEKVPNWDGNTGWDTTNTNLKDSYIHYGYMDEDIEKAAISIRKMAMATDKEDEFKVRLNVRGQTNYEPGVDIVLLLDNSKSLNSIPSKPDALRLVTKLVDQLRVLKIEGKANIRLGAHSFSSYTTNEGIFTTPISDNTDAWKEIYSTNGYGKYPSGGGTFTQRGLIEANDLFKQAEESDRQAGKNYNRKKMLMVFTDGAPNLSWKPTKAIPDSTMYYDQFRVEASDSQSGSAYKAGSSLGASSSRTKFSSTQNYGGGKFSSHITMANSAAYDVKAEGVEIHTLAVDIVKTSGDGHSESELIEGLFRMASRKANATGSLDNQEDYFFQLGTIYELEKYIDEWYKEISQSVKQAKIDDPLGEMVALVGTPTITQVAGETTKLPSVEMKENNRRLTVEDLNLYNGQEVQIEYTVKLRTDDPAYVVGKWYPTNGRTTLAPTPENSSDVLDFAVPSVRLKANSFEVAVEKRWEDQEDFWGLRPNKVVAVLQRKEDEKWLDVRELDVTDEESWNRVFDAVAGKNTEYRVIEKERVTGYSEATYTPEIFTETMLENNCVTMTNRLMTTDYVFKKYSHDGHTPFTGTNKPKFKVTRQAKNGQSEKIVVTDLEPAEDGTVKIENLPIGSYVVEEIAVPDGHSKMANFTIEVTENDAGTAVEAKVIGQDSPHTVINKLKDFTLIVYKVDDKDAALEGASFRVTGPDGYDQIIDSGSQFTFTGLKPGSYTLKEEAAPKGYLGLTDELEIIIGMDGQVTFTANESISGSSSLKENKIELNIKNTSFGKLPSTGGKGTNGRYIALVGCVVIGLFMTGCWVILEKIPKK